MPVREDVIMTHQLIVLVVCNNACSRPFCQMHQIDPQTSRRAQSMAAREFVRTSDEACESTWSTWPEMQERAIQAGTVLIWNFGTSIGHFFKTLIYILQVRN